MGNLASAIHAIHMNPPNSSPRFTDRQMNALEALIVYSDKSAIGKKTLVWALRQTQNLTKPVAIMIPFRTESWTSQRFDDKDFWNWAELALDCSHGITSSMGLTHLGLIMRAMGSKFIISEYQKDHYAYIVISPTVFDKSLKPLKPTYDEVRAIKVADPNGALNGQGEPFMDFQRKRD